MQTLETNLNPESIETFETYLYERENAPATIRKYVTDIRTFCRYLGEDHLISKKRLLAYKQWLLDQGYTVNSANSMLAALNQYLDFAGLGALKVRRFKVQKSLFLREEKELTVEEYHRLLGAAKRDGNQQLALCMETIAATGIRISELSAFTVEAVRRNHILLANKGKYRRIFLPRELRKKLLHYAGARELIRGPIFVTRTGRPKTRGNIWREMKALKEKAGVDGEKIVPHNLRHLFARMYYEMTRDLAGLGDLLGHSSLNVTRIYTANTGKTYQRQLDRLQRRQFAFGT